MKKRDKVLREARTRLQTAFGDKVKDVILFGSRAWGRPKPWSDWDFVVVVRGDYDWRVVRGIRDVMAYLDLDFDVFTQTLVISEEELLHSLRGKQPLFTDATQNGIYA
ncbi:MAG: nucleotidyltransferase domain-containing protein [Saprospiraceae bacterium]|jgi:predicted nucleotidyltransferase|nr:nucleotidyltransferase domain-containing protein [Saprospiraceae bacterium]